MVPQVIVPAHSGEDMSVALDFDGTLVSMDGGGYPGIGTEDLGALPWLQMAENLYPGIRWYLWTCRADDALYMARQWLTEHDFDDLNWRGFNANPDDLKKMPISDKIFCQIYVDERNLGAPLRADGCLVWSYAGPLLLNSIEARLRGSW